MGESKSERPEHAAFRAETRRLIEAKLDELPDAFRTVFVLRAIEEFSVEETSAALDIPEATVRTRFFRAKSLLREALSREIDLAHGDAFAFAGARCDRIVANVMARLKGLRAREPSSRSLRLIGVGNMYCPVGNRVRVKHPNAGTGPSHPRRRAPPS